jgi:hypothetical protein
MKYMNDITFLGIARGANQLGWEGSVLFAHESL